MNDNKLHNNSLLFSLKLICIAYRTQTWNIWEEKCEQRKERTDATLFINSFNLWYKNEEWPLWKETL